MTTDFGIDGDMTLVYMRMGIMASAIAVGLLGQFWPQGFPDGSIGIGVCVALYFALSGLLTLYQHIVERQTIFVAAFGSKAKRLFSIRTSMNQFEAAYTMQVEFDGLSPAARPSISRSYGTYMTAHGHILRSKLAEDLRKLLEAESTLPEVVRERNGNAARVVQRAVRLWLTSSSTSTSNTTPAASSTSTRPHAE